MRRWSRARLVPQESAYSTELTHSTSLLFGSAPILVAATWPFLNSIIVGMPRTPYLRRRLRVLVDIDLGDRHLAGHLGGEFVEERRDHLARAAPLGPEIDEDRLLGAEHHRIEAAVADGRRLHREILSSPC